MLHARPLVLVLTAFALLAGCAGPTTLAPEREAIPYREDRDLQRVWVAEGFDRGTYDTLLVDETRVEAVNVNPDGVENLAWARGLVRDEIVAAMRARKVAPTVAGGGADVRPGARVLRLETTIVEYEKGGGAARYFAGLYGAGQPVIRVRGRLTDGGRLVAAFEARRSGDSGLARVFGGYRSDRAIQEEDIRDLARDLAEFLLRNGQSR